MATLSVASAPEVVRQLLAGTGDLPVLPQAASRIMQELQSPKVTALRIAELVKKDPVLATAVLRVANSALYGGRTEITDLAFAMTRIGLNQVKNLILALVLRSRMADPQVYGSAGSRVMDHSLAVAFGARLVADAANQAGEESFLCGLLHDFGRLALVKGLREAFSLRTPDLPPDLDALVAAHHSEAGAALASRWGLPEVVSEVARNHHKPETPGPYQKMTLVVAFANALSHKYGIGTDAALDVDLEGHPAVAGLGLRNKDVVEISEHLPGLFMTARSALG